MNLFDELFGYSMRGTHESRCVANTEVDGGVVDTARVDDAPQPFETGVQHPAYREDGKWVIVECYDTREDAVKGHEKWVKIMEGKPARLEDVSRCGVVQLGSVFGISLNGCYERDINWVAPKRKGEDCGG